MSFDVKAGDACVVWRRPDGTTYGGWVRSRVANARAAARAHLGWGSGVRPMCVVRVKALKTEAAS